MPHCTNSVTIMPSHAGLRHHQDVNCQANCQLSLAVLGPHGPQCEFTEGTGRPLGLQPWTLLNGATISRDQSCPPLGLRS